MSAYREPLSDVEAPDRESDGSWESLREHSWFAPLLGFFGYEPTTVDPRVHRADEMFEQALLESGGDFDAAVAAYLATGAQVARTVENFVRGQWGDLDPSWSMLDFGCGYGRVTRFFAATLGNAGGARGRVWASDLLSGTVEFQREALGAESFVSHADPTRVEWPRGDFDLIYVGSLFTHLPRATFDAWLETLFGKLSERGVLLFSVHDLRLKPPTVAVDGDGFAFVESSESREIDHAVYGSTWLGRAALQNALSELAHRAGGPLHWRRDPRALCGYQDLVAVSRQEIRGAPLGCIGAVDDARIQGDKRAGRFDLEMEGWCLEPGFDSGRTSADGGPDENRRDGAGSTSPAIGDARERPTVEVRLLSDRFTSAVAESTMPDADRGDLEAVREDLGSVAAPAGWKLELPLPPRLSRGRDLLLVRVRSVGEPEPGSLLFAGTIDRLLLDRAQEHFRLRRDRVYELAETIEQVKQSRFWRARAAWFGVKRKLGWTEESASGPDLEPSDRRP